MRRPRPTECALDEAAAEAVADTGADGDPAGALMEEAGVSEILAALDALPEELAETVRLAWLHELPYAEIAAVTEVPVGTVKSRESRARQLVQKMLRRRS